MASVEIDEVELARLRKGDQTVQTIMKHPKARRKVWEAFREADPNVVIPELAAEEAASGPMEALRKEFSEYRAQQEKRDSERETAEKSGTISKKIADGIASLKAAGWTEDGIKGVRELMDSAGIIDVEIAASHFEKIHPPPTPAAPSGHGPWNFMDTSAAADDKTAAQVKMLIDSKGHNPAVLDSLIKESLTDFRTQTARR